MKNYKKPAICVINELSEGVYLASGDSVLNLQCEDCDYFVFNQPVKIEVLNGVVRSGAMYSAKYGIPEENSYVVSINDKGQQYAYLTVTAKESGHGPVVILDQGSAHGWTRN